MLCFPWTIQHRLNNDFGNHFVGLLIVQQIAQYFTAKALSFEMLAKVHATAPNCEEIARKIHSQTITH